MEVVVNISKFFFCIFEETAPNKVTNIVKIMKQVGNSKKVSNHNSKHDEEINMSKAI